MIVAGGLASLQGFRGIIGLIGKTPLVRVSCFDTADSELWLELESHNPGGSIKEPIAALSVSSSRTVPCLES